MPTDTVKVYVLHWEHKDKSGQGIAKIYQKEQDAIDAYEILVEYDTTRDWFIDPYPVQ